jgi:hypothetical protein
MINLKKVLWLAVFSVYILNAYSYDKPALSDKIDISIIIGEVKSLSRKCRDLDTFGRSTMVQSRKVLDMGPCAVYTLSWYLDNPDWKVRFWIADIMGYLDNKDAQAPLLRLIENENEQECVKERALMSLNRLK